MDPAVQRWISGIETNLQTSRTDGEGSSLKGLEHEGTTLALLRSEICGIKRILARNPADRITIGIGGIGQCRGSAARREIRVMPQRLAFILMPSEVLKLDVGSPRLSGMLLQLPIQMLLEECQLHGTEDPDLLTLQETIPGHESLIMACAQQLLDLAQQPESPARSRLIQPLEASILSLVASLVGNANLLSPSAKPPEASQSSHVETALAYMEQHLADSINLTDLCRACCISARTLQIAFQVVMSRSPLQVLQELRLTRLRELLLQQMEVRRACKLVGLAPTGRMAANYRKLFGELPRQTKPNI